MGRRKTGFVNKLEVQFDQLRCWSADLFRGKESGRPYLTRRGGIVALNFDDMSVQSEMNIDKPDELVIPYTRAIMSFLLLNPRPERIAMIGLGGGSLAKYCYRYLPQTAISVIEISAEVIALRHEFSIPPDDERFQVLLGDGAAWVAHAAWQPDVLIVDGFDTDGLPPQLSARRFYDDCYVSLAESGIMAVNLWAGYPHFAVCLAHIESAFAGQAVVVDSADGVNKIVLAVKNGDFPPAEAVIRRHVKALNVAHPLNFQAKFRRLLQGFAAR